MAISCETQPCLHRKTRKPSQLLIDILHRLHLTISLRRRQQMNITRLNKLNSHLLKDINQLSQDPDPLGKHRAWNDPLYVEIRRWW